MTLLEELKRICIKPTHEAADAFWKYWKENGETHKHGYYESTWGAINAALNTSDVIDCVPVKELKALRDECLGNLDPHPEEKSDRVLNWHIKNFADELTALIEKHENNA